MPLFSKHFTRRQQVNYEINKDYFKLGLLLLLIIVIAALGIGNCVTKNCAEADEPEQQTEVVQQTDDSKKRERIETDSYPRLVNTDNILGADYVPPQLTRLYGMPDGVNVQLNFDAATAFTKLYNAMLEDGLGILPLSGYRTYEEQLAIFNYNVELHAAEGMTVEEARKVTEGFVAIPGSSEHQYGRSIDVTIDGTTNHTFHKTEQGKWLIDNAHKFGFIIRYPSDKVDITGINYEPWHLRYVGDYHAEYMHRYDLCLEEYIKLVLIDCPYAVSED